MNQKGESIVGKSKAYTEKCEYKGQVSEIVVRLEDVAAGCGGVSFVRLPANEREYWKRNKEQHLLVYVRVVTTRWLPVVSLLIMTVFRRFQPVKKRNTTNSTAHLITQTESSCRHLDPERNFDGPLYTLDGPVSQNFGGRWVPICHSFLSRCKATSSTQKRQKMQQYRRILHSYPVRTQQKVAALYTTPRSLKRKKSKEKKRAVSKKINTHTLTQDNIV